LPAVSNTESEQEVLTLKNIRIMATIKYVVKENKTIGTHSFYCVPQSYSTLNYSDMAEEVSEGLGISPDIIGTIIKRYMRVAIRSVQRGHRVKLGDELVVYPQISCSVKDELNDDGTVKKAATADMLNVSNARSTIGATISQAVQQSFAQSVSWKRVTEKADEEETPTDTTDPTTDPDQQGGGTEGGGTDPNE
jgi:hypothetical protein